MRKMALYMVKLLVSIPLSRKYLKNLSGFNMSRVLKTQQKEAISTLFSGKDLFAVLPTGFRKSLIFQVLVCKKVIMTGKLRA